MSGARGYRRGVSRGRLITIEGLDGAGKTTLATRLVEALAGRGIDARALREPGGAELSERIRDLLADPRLVVGARAEALLYAAARAELVQRVVEPLLAAAAWVVLDRHVDSSLAYQGAGRGLGVKEVRRLNDFATAGVRPDRTLLLRIDPARGRARQAGRGAAPERLELEEEPFFRAVAEAYDALAAAEPQRIAVIDADRPPQAVLADALAAVLQSP